MFLWPHTMSVVLKAQEDCVGTNFNAMYNHPYNLHCYSRNDGTLSFLNQASTLCTLCTPSGPRYQCRTVLS